MCPCVCQAEEFEDRSSKKKDGVEILVDQQDGKEMPDMVKQYLLKTLMGDGNRRY